MKVEIKHTNRINNIDIHILVKMRYFNDDLYIST